MVKTLNFNVEFIEKIISNNYKYLLVLIRRIASFF